MTGPAHQMHAALSALGLACLRMLHADDILPGNGTDPRHFRLCLTCSQGCPLAFATCHLVSSGSMHAPMDL